MQVIAEKTLVTSIVPGTAWSRCSRRHFL